VKRRYVTADVFTDRMFGGNPLAVVLDAQGLSASQMQAVALEFNYSETTFVLPPQNPAHTARVRIFTPRTEVPFAGHPNVGTAFVLAQESRYEAPAADGVFLFEETAGVVPLKLLRERGATVGAELCAPEPLSLRTIVSREVAAACLSLAADEIAMQVHAPRIVSVGLPFLVVQLDSREALRRSRPNLAAHAELFPLDGADAIFAYWRSRDESSAHETVLHARMFSPLDGTIEDPATGSACAATIALLASLRHDAALNDPPELAWRIHQGVDMGRPSLLLGRTARRDATTIETHIGGRCVPVLEGALVLSSAAPSCR